MPKIIVNEGKAQRGRNAKRLSNTRSGIDPSQGWEKSILGAEIKFIG
jgi:hypothetical protein